MLAPYTVKAGQLSGLGKNQESKGFNIISSTVLFFEKIKAPLDFSLECFSVWTLSLHALKDHFRIVCHNKNKLLA